LQTSKRIIFFRKQAPDEIITEIGGAGIIYKSKEGENSLVPM
jgi:hypothetical protein